MKSVTPYTSTQAALTELDNGGRFYNLFTRAGDGEITAAEISKVAGVFGDKQEMFLFLELALSKLDDAAANKVLSTMSKELNNTYLTQRPFHYSPAQALEQGEPGQSAIIRGIPKRVSETSKFTGLIMIPIMAGNVTSFAMIPIIEQYTVYELYDTELEKSFIIAHAKKDKPLKEKPTTVAGVLKELKSKKDEKKASSLFLEACYCLENETE